MIMSLTLYSNSLFFSNNSYAAEVIETEGWNRMVRDNPHIVAEVFKALAHQVPGANTIRKKLKHS